MGILHLSTSKGDRRKRKGAHKEKRRRTGSVFFLLVEMALIAHFRRVKGIGGMGKAIWGKPSVLVADRGLVKNLYEGS